VGKTQEEITAALKARILFFNVESIPELKLINKLAGKLNLKAQVAIRINPNVDADTHDYITTAKKQNKFGIDLKTTRHIFLNLSKELKNLDICGVHFHIGSQIEQVRPFRQALGKALELIESLRQKGCAITHLNIGGGLGIIYKKEKPQTAADYARTVISFVRGKKLNLILEPGRFVVGNAGVLLAKVIYVKNTPVKRFLIVDAAMNDIIRPSFYGAYHEIIPLNVKRKAKLKKVDVVGPVCESGDFIAKNRALPDNLKEGDVLAVMSAGAYCFGMASNYNSRCRPAEVLVKGRKFTVINRRQNYRDLIRGEKISNR
jgi:diaminopimelate decarboxylase